MMKYKSLCLMILVVLLCVCATTSISAGAIWDGGIWYEIDGFNFYDYQTTYEFEFENGIYEAYIYEYDNEEIQKSIIVSYDVDEYFVVYNTVTNEYNTVDITAYAVYINTNLYNYLKVHEGQIPLTNIVADYGAKNVFDSAATTTATVGSAVIDALYYDGNLTLLGWICCCGLGTTLTATLIKIISNTIRR